MEPRLVPSKEKKLVGKRIAMSLANNKTGELWRSFMPIRGKVADRVSDDLISMSVYGPAHFLDFKPSNQFEKWAALEVAGFENVSKDLETFILPVGLYAVFDYKGLSTDTRVFQYIFGEWLPGSDFELDTRPHFEILGQKYRNNDPDSEEEIWIPVKLRTGPVT
jgi:AraC family transcriptional regulator